MRASLRATPGRTVPGRIVSLRRRAQAIVRFSVVCAIVSSGLAGAAVAQPPAAPTPSASGPAAGSAPPPAALAGAGLGHGVEDLDEGPAPPVVEAPIPEPPRHARTAHALGFDIRFGLPHGLLSAPVALGIDLSWQPIAPLVVSLGGGTSGLTWDVHAEAQLNVLSIFDPSASLTPFVRGGVSHARFTAYADRLIDTFFPGLREDLQDAGTDLRFAGVQMNFATVSTGLDYVSPDGFHFQLAVGRAVLLGESRGADDEESVVLTEYASWTFQMLFGAFFF
ncbi:MAG TPA: hypothetical protein RMF84_09505 [Polyangiaceae bacterium LLY-WYZ-14_1]|nr:hypothetical protein [Polyangiaceae bacterium LLY-WYZ-14_1]